jgi:subtilisin family serine protease
MRAFQLRGPCAALVLAVFGLVATMPAGAAETASRMIVKFKAGALAAGKAEVARQGGRVLLDVSEMDALAVSLTPRAVRALTKSPNVEFIEVDPPRQLFAPARKTTRGAATTLAETTPYGITMVQADQVSDADAGNRTLCIIDSGIDGSHPDLQGLPMAGENFTPSGDWNTDENSHGTHVAGTIAAVGGNGIGVVGVLPNQKLKLYIAKVFDASGSAPSSTIAKAMLACRKNGRANLISMSLGGSRASRLDQLVVRFLAGRDILLIAAAGNNGDTSISYPAGYAEVMSAAAIDSTMAHADFSQSNPDVEIAAPGVDVLSTVPAFSETGATLTVAAAAYAVEAMEHSPRTSAAGPLADFGIGDTPVPGSMTGQVCLISRGTITFAEKVVNCQDSGGVAAVIYNNEPGVLLGTLSDTVTTIPSIGALQSDGALMLGQLGQSAAVSVFGLPDQYANKSGTSMAAPHTSAVAALVWSRHPGCTAAQMRESLNKAALDLGAVGRDDAFGHGLVRAAVTDRNIAAFGCGG